MKLSQFNLLIAVLLVFSSTSQSAERFVNPSHPNSSDTLNGASTMPFKTIGAAMQKLEAGDHLYISPGIYREAILFKKNDWGGKGQTVIEGQVIGEKKVLIKGSQIVSEWQTDTTQKGLFVTLWKTEPQQVYINGVALKQIEGTIFGGFPTKPNHELRKLHANQGGIWPKRVNGDATNMPEGSFFYEQGANKLYIRCNCSTLADKVIEVSMLRYLVDGTNLQNILLKNITFQHSTTSTLSRGEAVTLRGKNIRIENIDVTDMDAGCIGLRGENITLINSSMGRCGQTGLAAKGDGINIENNRIYENNTRGFNKWWEAGGAKFVGEGGISNSKVIGNRVENNFGDGIWFDWGPSNNLIKSNVVLSNNGFGIHYEASYGGRIEENVVALNRQRGIYLPHSSNSQVIRNVVVANEMEGIAVVDEGRRDKSEKLKLLPKDNLVCGNVVAWNTGGALILPADILNNRSDWNTYIGFSKQVKFALGWWPNRIRPSGLNLSSWQTLTSQDKNSVVIGKPVNELWISGLHKLGQEWKISDLMESLLDKTAKFDCSQ